MLLPNDRDKKEREQREIAEAMAIEEREKKEKLAARL
ncbi:Uma2 family endonuclease, partial [Cylindrospermopsis raciborskii MVCC19]|nr:Uma2 family endonuclease [Cylindrospermopsis raciborskii MVCC19]